MKLVKVTEVYIDSDDLYQNPVFKLEDGTLLAPKAITTGSCWVLAWEAVLPEALPNADGPQSADGPAAKPTKPVETFLCQSYAVDGEVHNCTCGKCAQVVREPTKTSDAEHFIEHRHGPECEVVMAIRNTTINEGIDLLLAYTRHYHVAGLRELLTNAVYVNSSEESWFEGEAVDVDDITAAIEAEERK